MKNTRKITILLLIIKFRKLIVFRGIAYFQGANALSIKISKLYFYPM